MKYQIIQGDNREVLKQYPDNHFDSIITDPPYGIGFLGKDWDSKKATETTTKLTALHNLPSGMKMTSLADDLEFQYWLRDLWIECYRVLKPGGHILAFSAARTYHHMAMSLQTAGFEIRDQIMWIYSSGFPKSQDVGKSIDRQSGRSAHKADLAEVKAILKQLYKASGKSNTQIDRECGFNAGGYLKTDFKDRGWANNLPRDDKWLKLKSVLGCGDDYDDYFITTPQIKVGEKEAGCFDQEFENYTIGARSKMVDITASQTDAGQQWQGWGTALKPAHEPICMARKPSKLSTAKNVQQWGVGALNIDATRIPIEGKDTRSGGSNGHSRLTFGEGTTSNKDSHIGYEVNEQGRFPSNVLGEIPDYQKYFYCPKVSRRERHAGFDLKKVPTIEHNDPETIHLHPLWTPAIGKNVYRLKEAIEKHNNEVPPTNPNGILDNKDENGNQVLHIDQHRTGKIPGNNHPTVKPVELMKYLIKLVTPPGGRVLDPFNGSGSTGMAAVELGHEYVGIELDTNYVEISKKRISAWFKQTDPLRASGLFD